MPRFASPVWLAAVLSAAAPAADPPKPVTVRVLTPDGKPAAGATVWAYLASDATARKLPAPAKAVADADGRARVAVPEDERGAWAMVYARGAAGRVGGGQPWQLRTEGTGELTVTLFDVADRSGRVTDPAGKPIAGAVVRVRAAYPPQRGNGWSGGSVQVPPWEQERAATRTDADGRFTLKGLPVGHELYFQVAADGVGQTWYVAPADGPLDLTLAPPGKVRVSVTGVDPAALKGASYRLAPPDRAGDRRPMKVTPRVDAHGQFDGKAELAIKDVVPGRYTLTVSQAVTAPALPGTAAPFEVTSRGETKVTLPFGPAAKVAGKVVDQKTGAGVAGVKLAVYHRADGRGSDSWSWLGQVETAADGAYTAHGPAGWFRVAVLAAPDGYAVPRRNHRQPELIEPARVELGKDHTFADLAIPRSVTFAARLVLADGSPAAGATVESPDFHTYTAHGAATASPDGTVAFKNRLPDDVLPVRARLGTAVNVPATFDLTRHTEPETITLSEANAAGFAGVVTDARGRPLAGARVDLVHWIPGTGRDASMSLTMTRATVRTAADGKFAFPGLWPKDRYDLKVSADGYGEAEVKNLPGEAGTTREVPPVRLAAFAAVAGVVVGEDGKPVEGATVFAVDGPKRVEARTAADGRFTLSGYSDPRGFVFARKPGFRLAAVPVTPGAREPAAVTLRRADATPPPAPVVPPEHAAAQAKFLRHLLQKMWDTRGELDYGRSAVQYMAKVDPATARKWVAEEKERSGGKNDWGRLVDAAQREKALLATAAEDVDEAVATLQGVTGRTGFDAMLRLGRQLLRTDKAKAARLAEEAAVRARQLPPTDNTYMLAQAGELAAQAGNRAGGEKVVREAAALAAKLPADGADRQTLARGIVAARLAAFDWPAAKALLDPLKQPGEFNRFLASAIDRVAVTDPKKAQELFALFRPDGAFDNQYARLHVAARMAAADPDGAERVVDGVPNAAHRFLGYVRLARLTAGTDKPRAARLLDRAMALLEGQPEEFRSWSGMGGRAGFALIALNRAAEVGHPDVAGLVAAVLSYRPTVQDAHGSPEMRADQLVQVAAGLALVDPATARQVLAGVAPPDQFAEIAVAKRREWVYAAALTDPVRGTELVDRVFARAKTAGQRSLSRAGVSELASILTADERYAELAMFSSLIRETGEPE